jgi:hypothetical protein
MFHARFVAGFVAGAIVLCISFAAGAGEKKKEEGKKVELTGVVKTGVVALGGETTGTELQTKEGRYELAVPKDLKADVEKLDGKMASVTGTLIEKRGVEVRKRRIVTVTTIKEAEEKK